MENTDSRIFTFNESIVIDLAALPQSVIDLATTRGLRHVLSNEALSKAGTVAKKLIASGELSQDEYESKVEELAAEYRMDYVASFYDGSWGTRSRAPSGPRMDAFESTYAKLVAKTVRKVLNDKVGKGVTYDKATKTWNWVAASGPQSRTIESAIEGYEARMKPEERAALETAAREMVEAAKRAAAASKAATIEDTELDL
jgi:hypothetical protein